MGNKSNQTQSQHGAGNYQGMYKYRPDSIPISQNEADADPISAVVIIDHAFTITCEVLDVATDSLYKWKTPFKLEGTSIVAKSEVITQHRTEPMSLPEIVSPYLARPHILVNMRIIILVSTLGDAIPGLKEHSEAVSLEPHVCHDPVPAPGEWFRATVGLMIEAHIYVAGVHSQKAEIGAKIQQKLRLIVGLTERSRILGVVELPKRLLGIAEPQVHILVEDILPELDLLTYLKLDLVLEDILTDSLLDGTCVWGAVIRERQDVVGPMCPDDVFVSRRILIQVPQLREVRASSAS